MDGGIDGVIGRREQERVAVRGRLGGGVGRNDTAGPRSVLDHEWTAELLRHSRGYEPGDVIHGPAGREWQQQADRLFRIVGPTPAMH
jgi:hypothetical protein